MRVSKALIMTIHYQQTEVGLRAAYVTRIEGNVDEVVRKVLGMTLTEVKEPSEIGNDPNQPYIIDGPRATIYYQPWLNLQDTCCAVEVPKDGKPVVVSINTRIPMDPKELETLIQIAIIDGKLIPAGLMPIESKREDIPAAFLRA